MGDMEFVCGSIVAGLRQRLVVVAVGWASERRSMKRLQLIPPCPTDRGLHMYMFQTGIPATGKTLLASSMTTEATWISASAK